MSLIRHLAAALEAYDQEDEDRHAAIVNYLTQIKDELMVLRPEVQALHDSVATMSEAITTITGGFDELEVKIAEQKAMIEALQATHTNEGTISPEDLAEIVGATTAIQDSVKKIKDAMPAPIEQPVVDAAAAASEPPADQPA